MILFISSIAVLLIVSFFCSISEATLLSIDNVKLETDKNRGLGYAIKLSELRQNINRPIAAILILNTIANTGGATFAGIEFANLYGSEWMWLYSTLLTAMVLFGTEILPKVIGVTHSESLAKILTQPLSWILKALYPLVIITEAFSKVLTGRSKKKSKYSIEDLHTLTKAAKVDNIIDLQQQKIIIKTSTLKRRKADEIMLPMDKVIYITEGIHPEEYFGLARKHLHTRYPIASASSPKELLGYLNLKEIALHKEEIAKEGLTKFVRPLLFVNKSMTLTMLLKEFSSRKNHLAIVQDDNNQNIGMITMEDVVEEIVGEIQDEFDAE